MRLRSYYRGVSSTLHILTHERQSTVLNFTFFKPSPFVKTVYIFIVFVMILSVPIFAIFSLVIGILDKQSSIAFVKCTKNI